ncbi:MAG: hypothetical protein QN168_11780 [Armatimonadota bacterium]|nr:hypothetical protein [Armatimonadota bacterium]
MIDVLGRDLASARAALEAAGYRVEVIETRTPRRVTLFGPLRVVRQREGADRTVQLVVTHERYGPPAGTAGG